MKQGIIFQQQRSMEPFDVADRFIPVPAIKRHIDGLAMAAMNIN